ncbi:NAD-dependent epimerase/dehydratase family protein [Sagittula salina]|uniref:NAD(P)-dependent oxidoreductase n=1 Tax=Sagittula salina TaxID=2820268 RepID=A0A940MT18_9RHOB|nr:NAD(P)-dependent oxidoreductase [Sagittula salina]MBP0484321.1 NAD(P)-dependent oxidoreductase [Sagittula salina]
MGEVTGRKTVLVTGANGFVGRACVAEARRHGLPVIALYRAQPVVEWASDPGITAVRLDLSEPGGWFARQLPESGAVIHAAGHLGADPAALKRDTVDATRAVLAGRDRDGAARLVLISSLAVYDFDALSPGQTLTEAAALIPLPEGALDDPETVLRRVRDAYAGAKRLQEVMMRDLDDAWILRPGAIWGPGRTWHALQGFRVWKLFVTIGSKGELPLAHVTHVARAAVEAARTPTEGVTAVNVFDDDRPTRGRFLRVHRHVQGWPRLSVTVPYTAWLALVRLLGPLSAVLPGLLREPVLRARMMPLRFPNTRLRHALGGADHASFEDLMRAAKGQP